MTPVTKYPLTALQQGMVYHSLMAPGDGVYLEQLCVEMPEALDVAAFRQAWRRVVARHDALRTRFLVDDPEDLLQEVVASVETEWTEGDWSQLPGEIQRARWEEFLDADRRRGFDFGRAPLMRVALFRLGPEAYRFVWTFHHALADGRSFLVVLTELFELYEASLRGEEVELGDTPRFRDFVHGLSELDHDEARSFWEEQLRGFEMPTRLGRTDAAAPGAAAPGSRGVYEVHLPEEASRRVHEFAGRHDLTPATLIMGAWAQLLRRYSGSNDVLFGATRAGRGPADGPYRATVGLLINTVPLRIRASGDTPVLEWLQGIRSQWIAMRPYEHTPLVDISRWTGIERGQQLFESVVVIEGYSLTEQMRSRLPQAPAREFTLLEHGDLPLAALAYVGSRLMLRLGYNRAQFDDATAERMLQHWQTLLEGLIEDPRRRLADLPMLTPAERRTVLEDWAITARRDFPAALLHELVEAQAARTPDHDALLFEDGRISYRQMNESANQLAHHLRDLGVGPEVRVVLSMERRPEIVIAILAVVKAGGAYVPVDPAYPKDRLAAMIGDSGGSFLLTQDSLRDRLPAGDLRVVSLEADAAAIARRSRENPNSGVRPDNLAYAIFTSGSTGRPKLIGIEHRSLANTVHHTTQCHLTAEELAVVPFHHTISFDPSVHWIFTILSNGGTLVVVDSLLALPLSQHAAKVTLLPAPASMFEAMLRDYPLPESVRAVSTGAEAPSDELFERLAGFAQVRRIFNGYGPTEASVYCTAALTYQREPDGGAIRQISGHRVIGRPISNMAAYLLDDDLNPVPIGVAGELHIGGVGLARGYLNNPDLTARCFISDPFSDDPDARLYKTGDLVRYLEDGRIEFLGRKDTQVQIRGLRIEPQGIAAVLRRHPTVRDCVVRATSGATGETQLVAYVVACDHPESDDEEAAIEADLDAYMESQVPRHMRPAVFMLLAALPMTSGGKLDLKALPEPRRRRRAGAEATPPRSDMEATLAASWEAVLGVAGVGVFDDFFALGGDSLSAMRMINRVNQDFGTNLPVSVAFEAPTVESMSLAVLLNLAEMAPAADVAGALGEV